MALDDDTIQKIRESRGGMSFAEQRIANYILTHAEDIPHTSLRTLAHLTRTSEASVMQFCKTMGYRGYRELIINFATSLGARREPPKVRYTDIHPGDSLDTIITNVAADHCRAVEDTVDALDKAKVERAVQLLTQAWRVEFYGIGTSGNVCREAYEKFRRLHINCAAYTDGHSQLDGAALLEKGDVVLAISHSGNTIDTLEAMRTAKSNGAAAIAITRYALSAIANEADLVLPIVSPESTIRSGPMSSRIAMLALVDILYAGLAALEN